MKLTRRAFLVLVPLALASIGLLARALFYESEALIEAILRRRLAGLDLEPTGVSRFAREYVSLRPHAQSSLKWRVLYTLWPAYGLAMPLLRGTATYESLYEMEASVVGQYLLCTDYFRDGKQPLEVVRSLQGIHGPCANPFARFA